MPTGGFVLESVLRALRIVLHAKEDCTRAILDLPRFAQCEDRHWQSTQHSGVWNGAM